MGPLGTEQCHANATRWAFGRSAENRRLEIDNNFTDLSSLLPDAWITAHPEHLLEYRRVEAEAAASAQRRRRAIRRAKTREPALSL
jgi:hypothetical protein